MVRRFNRGRDGLGRTTRTGLVGNSKHRNAPCTVVTDTLAHRVVITKHGGPDVLRHEAWQIPEPGEGEVQVAVEAAGINFADLMMRMGLYPEAPEPPFVPGYEVAGRIGSVADGVKGLKPGDRVVAATRFGGYTSHTNLPAEDVIKVPRALDLEQAAALPVQYVTAWIALHEYGRIREGDRVLVHGGAGGVGQAAVAMAQAAGCDVVATAGGKAKVAMLRERFGIEAFDHHVGHVRHQLDAQHGFDLILDPVGGRHLKESLLTLRPGGRVILYGMQSLVTSDKGRRSLRAAARELPAMKVKTIPMMLHNTGVQGLNLLSLWKERPDVVRHAMDGVTKALARKRIPAPTIAASYPLAEAAKAHQAIHDRRHAGKVLLTS